MKSESQIISQWHRLIDKNSRKAREMVAQYGTPLEIISSELQYMTQTQLARHHKLMGIWVKIEQIKRRGARERLLLKRKLKKN